MSAQVHMLADGRLHLHHGPIDLICQAWGDAGAMHDGYARAASRFGTVLGELVAELPALRAEKQSLIGLLAHKMGQAVAPFRPTFITPMAAIAGAVAEEVLAQISGSGITRAYVNNGGDIALYLTPGTHLVCAIATGGTVRVDAHHPVRGIATSGWRGRSWSLGIADAVTVLARTAAMADAAATMIANAVDLPGHTVIARRPARDMQVDSDLGNRLVTVGVGALTDDEADHALEAGLAAARDYATRGLIEGAALFLQGRVRTYGHIALPQETALA